MTEYIFPLSFAQERLWFVHQLHPDSPTYNIPMILRLRGDFHEEAMRRSLNDIVRRHDALRTTFAVIDGTPMQKIRASWPLTFQIDDLSVLPVELREAEVERRIDGERYTPFDLENDQLIRASAIRCTGTETVLLLTVHHIICDGWAQDVLLSELAQNYRSALEGRPLSLPEPKIQYPDFAVWQRDTIDQSAGQAALDYWCSVLVDAPLDELPGDFPRGQADPVAGARHTFTIPAELVDRLRPVCAQEQATPFMMLLTALDILLARLIGTDDVLVGTSAAGRTRPELDSVIGCFLNTLVLRTDLRGDPSYREVLRRVRGTALGALEHQDLPFERVVTALGVPRDMSRAPLFQVMFVHQNVPGEDVSLPGLDGTLELLTNDTSKLDILLDTFAGEGGIVCRLEYMSGLFEQRTMERFGEQLTRVLAAAAADPEVRMSEVELVDGVERESALSFGGARAALGGEHIPVPQLVEMQARRRPDAIAVRSRSGVLTYSQLVTRAGELADRLRAAGLEPDEPVMVVADGGCGSAVALLGVLAADGSVVSGAGDARFMVTAVDDSIAVAESGAVEPPSAAALTGRLAVAVAHWVRETFSDGELAGVVATEADDLVAVIAPLCWGGGVLIAPRADAASVAELGHATTWFVPADGDVGAMPEMDVACVVLPALSAAIPRIRAKRRVAMYAPAGLPCAGAVVAADGDVRMTPMDGMEIYLLDTAGRPVPPGRPGEVCIGGDGLHSRDAVVPDPSDGARRSLVPVGDKARWTDSGELIAGVPVEAAGLTWEPAAMDCADASATARVEAIWRDALGIDRAPHDMNFFDLGGHSLAMVRVQAAIAKEFGRRLPLLDLFANPTVRSLAGVLAPAPSPSRSEASVAVATPKGDASQMPTSVNGTFPPLAVVGMACRFPGAQTPDEFWANLLAEVDSTEELTDDDLRAAGLSEAEFNDAGYVRRIGLVRGGGLFDAGYFGMGGREAELVDPQQRFFLETAHDALQDAGYDPDQYDGRIGLFGGTGLNLYGWLNVAMNPAESELTHLQGLLAVEKDHAATRAAYRLNLRGPAISVQTACSTSLVAICTAARALVLGECEIAIAGGTNMVANPSGYRYAPGGINSPDGLCRAFDKDSAGTTPGMGSGFVVLRLLRDALEAGDTIHAVLIGAATNNDGSDKIGYTAPSIRGQESVLRAAHRSASVGPHSIAYVEAHGTGTALGDPIEIFALNRAFGERPESVPPCAIGSVKTNIGHLDAAAGVAGFIKTALTVKHGVIPPSLHFMAPNPEIDFGSFRVNTAATPWPTSFDRRRAGVSAFGVGGTNAHVVLEEAPSSLPGDPAQPWQLVVLSADSEPVLRRSADRLAAHLEAYPDANLADVAFTLQVGRRARTHRLALVARDVDDAVAVLRSWDTGRLRLGQADVDGPPQRPWVHPESDADDDARRDALDGVATAWAAGVPIDWSALHRGARRRRIPLPTYPFEKRRYFIEIEGATPSPERRGLADAAYLPTWTRTLGNAARAGNRCLVVHDATELADEIVARLGTAGAQLVTASPGDGLMALVRRLRAESSVPTTIIHCVGANEQSLVGYRSLLALARTLAVEHVVEVTEVVVITDAGQAVAGEGALNPFAAMQAGLAHVMRQELRGVACRTIDVAACVDPLPIAAGNAVAESLAPPVDPLVALRGADRWVPAYTPLPLASPPERSALRERGTYLVLGAGGTIGRAIADHLARRVRANLVLVRRSPWRDQEHADRLTAYGAEVMTVSADIADPENLRGVVREAEARFGPIHGVVNAAGVVQEDYAALLGDLDEAVCERNFRVKLTATEALWEVFGERDVDFCVMCSSVSVVLGGLGYGAYAAANAYLDAFVERARRRHGARWLAIDWDAWRGEPAETGSGLGAGPERHSLSGEEGGDLFERMVTGHHLTPRLVNSMTDLNQRLAAWVTIDGARELPARAGRRYPRPDLKVAYVAPRTTTETVLAEIWSEALSLDSAGVFDDFFDLGGDSLLALHLVDAMEREFGRPVPLESVLASTTIERLAELVTQSQAEQASASSVAVPLGGSGPAILFLIHPLAGTVLCYRGLGERLRATVYGLQTPSLVEDPDQPFTFEDLAERYVREIKSVQPSGPYLVGGYSMGGALAYEVSRRMVTDGDEVAWTGLIDGCPPQLGRAFFEDAALLARSTTELLDGVGIGVTPEVLATFPPEADGGRFASRVDLVAEWMRAHRLLSSNADHQRRARLLLVGYDNRNAYHRWQPGGFTGRVSVYATSETAGELGDTLGWQGLVDADGQVIVGSHEHLLAEPALTDLVGRLQRDLSRFTDRIS
jgi:acyl transferase domain-containing protein/non-ribosomal peptide synthetase component F/thioesterase domain-containing protein/acyl carrier protein